MIFANYDKWRAHPIFRFTGVRDLRHLFPGFGTAVGLFAVYLTYSKVIKPAIASDSHDHEHHEHHVIIKGASHARQLQEQNHEH